MVSFNQTRSVLFLCLTLSTFGLFGCGDSANGTGGVGATGATGGSGGQAGVGGTGGMGGTDQPKAPRVLFVGGFMSELYEALSINLESKINTALRAKARTLNVVIELPLTRDIELPIGDAVANALPWIELPIEPGGFVSFHTQEVYFLAQDIAFHNLSRVPLSCPGSAFEGADFDTSESVANNAEAILCYLSTSEEKITIVSHSKGGLDTLEALVQAPELVGETVVGWVALQSPFYGSPVADPAPSNINDLLLGAVDGNGQALDDLKTSERERYMAYGDELINEVTATIPVISAYSTYEAGGAVTDFASAFANSIIDANLISQITQLVIDNYWASPLDIPGVVSRSVTSSVTLIRARVSGALLAAVATVGLMDVTNTYMNSVVGVPNDGLVPRDSTELPGAIHRKLTFGDHASPVMDVDPLENFWTAAHRDTVTAGLVAEVRALAGVDAD